jgi:predicted nucleic acid-binding protein
VSTFADASALVKFYADEEGHEAVRELTAVAIAQVSRVEVPAALWRKHRLGEITPDEAQVLTSAFEADYFGANGEPPRFATVVLSPSILDQAARLCATHSLRAYDAVQLSSAIAAREADPGCASFAVNDDTLRTAAAAEGFSLIPAAEGLDPRRGGRS